MIDYHPYDVRISGDREINAKNILRIEAECKNKDTIRVVYTGDTQGWMDETRDMVSSINNRGNIDFVVHGGDVSDFGLTQEFEWQRDILNKLSVPYVVIIGNHDCVGTGKQAFRDIFGTFNFSFIAGRVKFVCLNTNAIEYDYTEPVPDFDFMEQETKTDSDRFDRTIISMHTRPYSDQFNNNVAKAFEYYVKMFPGVLFCTVAHDHSISVNDIYNDGITYYGSDCAKDRNYLLFTITPNGYEYEVVYF
jgi:3',5'-cyclic AMP phosphodiesterase CpdA